jgi:hypothetical protein
LPPKGELPRAAAQLVPQCVGTGAARGRPSRRITALFPLPPSHGRAGGYATLPPARRAADLLARRERFGREALGCTAQRQEPP